MIILLFVLFSLLIFFGVPIVFGMGISGLIIMKLLGIPVSLAIVKTLGGMNSFTLMAIPFFILAGQVMEKAGIVSRIMNFANSIVGRMRGGLGHVNIIASMIFAGISGSGIADTAAIGGMIIPAMVKEGYDKDFAVAVTATSAIIGPIIPPSIPLVLYGIIARQSIRDLLLGGIIPGILVGFGLMIMNHIVCVKRGYEFRHERFSIKRVIKTGYDSIGALIMPLIIVGGIVGGFFTATEAGVVAVVYGFLYGIFVTRTLKLRHLPEILMNSAIVSAIVIYIVAMSTLFSQLLSRLQLKEIILNNILKITDNPFYIMLLLMAFFIFLGCFVDSLAMLIMFGPVLSLLAAQLGYHPIHFGVFLVMVMLIGAVTPPVGDMLFVCCTIAGIKMEESVKVLIPFIIVLILISLLVLLIPQTVIWIPSFFS